MKRFHPLLASTFSAFLTFSVASQSANTDENLATIAEQYRQLAEQGDMKAQSQLGYLYYVGEGVAQSYTEAVNWYRKAATQGDKDAQYNLAVAYAFGEGTTQDLAQAAMWYRRAAEQGHMISQYSLALSYLYGDGVEQNSSEAALWFTRAAEQGYTRAQVHLGSMYHTGDGVEQDYAQAIQWYRKAADRGDATAQYNLGSLYRSGKGVEQNLQQALRWFRLAADQGYAAAQNELSSLERSTGRVAQAASPQIRPGSSNEITQLEQTTDSTIDQANASLNTAVEKPPAETGDEPGLLSGLLAAPEEKPSTASDSPEPSSPSVYANPAQQMLGIKSPVTAQENNSQPRENTTEPLDSEPVVDATSDAEVNTIAETNTEDAVLEEPQALETNEEPAASKPGFFASLFGKKKRDVEELQTTESLASTEPRTEEAVSVAEPEPELEAVDESAPVVAVESNYPASYEALDTANTDIDSSLESEEVAAPAETASTELASDVVEPTEKKPGFFSRLFASPAPKTDTTTEPLSAATTSTENIEATPLSTPENIQGNDIALAESDSDNDPIASEPLVAVESNFPSSYQAPAESEIEIQEAPLKESLDEIQEQNLEESLTEPREIVLEQTREESLEEQLIDETPVEVIASEAESIDDTDTITAPKTEKKGFFSRLFGSPKETPPAENTALNADSVTSESEIKAEAVEENIETLAASTPEAVIETADSVEEQSLALFSDENDAAAVVSPKEAISETSEESVVPDSSEKEPAGFFTQLFGTANTTAPTEQNETTALLEEDISKEDISPSAQNNSASLEEGHQALQAQDYAKALAIYEPLAIAGNIEAQSQMASIYYLGSGVKQDYGRAFDWYRRAAEQGAADAQYSLGNMYLLGEGVEADNTLAQQWYEKAAAQGHESAQSNLEKIKRLIAATSPETASPVINIEAESATTDEPSEQSVVAEPNEVSSAVEPAIQAEEDTSQEKKRGFLSRLFGSDKKDKDKAEEKVDEAIPVSIASLSQPNEEPTTTSLTEDETQEHSVAKDFAESVYATAPTEPDIESSDEALNNEVISYAVGAAPAENALGFEAMEPLAVPEASQIAPSTEVALDAAENADTLPIEATGQPEKQEDFRFFDQLFSDENITRTELGIADVEERLVSEKDAETHTIANSPISDEVSEEATEPEVLEETVTQPETELPVAKDTTTPPANDAPASDAENEEKKGFFASLFGNESDKAPELNNTNESSLQEEPLDKLTAATSDSTSDVFDSPIADSNTESKTTAIETVATPAPDSLAGLQTLAVQGDATAQFELGNRYYEGIDVEQDYDQAFVWYRRAAQQGDSESQFKLGTMYLMGEGVSQSDIEAATWYKLAADQGHTSASHNYANLQKILQIPGERIEATTEVVAPQLAKTDAATNIANESPQAIPTPEQTYQLAMSYAFGDGYDKNLAKAFELFNDAANQGHAAAQYRLALAYAYGEGTTIDEELAVEWYVKAAKQDYTIAQRNLAAMYLQGKGVSQDKIKALAWYDIVANKGNVMDIQRRDRLQSELDNHSLEASRQLSAELLSEVSSIN